MIYAGQENKLTDFFIHTRGYFNLPEKGLALDLGYMDNGADFRSYGAQSKRINYNQQNNFYKRLYRDAFSKLLAQGQRDPTQGGSLQTLVHVPLSVCSK